MGDTAAARLLRNIISVSRDFIVFLAVWTLALEGVLYGGGCFSGKCNILLSFSLNINTAIFQVHIVMFLDRGFI